MTPRTHFSPFAILFALSLFVPAGLLAQPATVYSTNSSNNRILELDFGAATSAVVNTDAPARVRLGALVFSPDGSGGHLLVTDPGDGRVLFYQNAGGTGLTVTTAAKAPDGISRDVSGDAYFVSSCPGASDGCEAQVWKLVRDGACPLVPSPLDPNCAPGRFQKPAFLVDGDVEVVIGGNPVQVTTVVDTRVVPFTEGLLAQGDLLVAASAPQPMILRYPKDASSATGFGPEEVFAPPSRFPAGADLSGMDWSSNDRELLVAASGGNIFRIDPGGNRVSPDFLAGLGPGKTRLATGPEAGVNRAFITSRNGGFVLRADILGDGTGVAGPAIFSGVQSPAGVTITTGPATGGSVPVADGFEVTFPLGGSVQSTAEVVASGGFVFCTEFLCPDPRESDRALPLSECDASLPAGVEIPAFVRTFDGKKFRLLSCQSTVSFEGVLENVSDDTEDCSDPDPSFQPRFFWGPNPDIGEPGIVDGSVLIDLTVACNSDRSWSRDTSFFLPTVRDTRTPFEIAETKVFRNREAVQSYASFITDRRVLRSLEREAQKAIDTFLRGQFDKSAQHSQSALDLIEANPGAFDNAAAGVNFAGELRARFKSAVFMLGKLF